MLQPADNAMGWIKRRDLRTVQARSALSEQFILAFEYQHDRREFHVIFNHEAGALEAAPVKGIPSVSDDDYYNVTLRFIEVGSYIVAIETKNLVLYKSERLSDTEDGGGKYSGQIIEDGQSNNLFNDVSELDRTMGDVSLRKLFPAVTTNDTDLLMGATVFISENPKDPNVSALLFSTKSWIDERKSAQNRIENYLAKGGQAAGSLRIHIMPV